MSQEVIAAPDTLPAETFGALTGCYMCQLLVMNSKALHVKCLHDVGGVGLIVGGISAILRGRPAVLLAPGTCLVWAAMGFGFSKLRALALHETDLAGNRRAASALAAGATGAVRGAFQGPKSSIAGGAMFSLLGYSGQRIYDLLDTAGQKQKPSGSLLDAAAGLNWSPVTKLSDEEYAKILDDKKMKLDVDIALIDDRIARLRSAAGGITPVQREGPR